MRALIAMAVALFVLLAMPLAALSTAGSPMLPSTEAVNDIPPAYVTAYQDASRQRCPTLPWPVIAAIGKIESDHGRSGGGRLGLDGRVSPPIIGPALDGSAGTQRILDTDGGMYDGDDAYDHAVGPMQFIPTTWTAYGVDATRDGLADPHNAIDAIHAAAAYLCGLGATEPTKLRDAVWAYNHSWDYVDKVLAQASEYASGGISHVAPSPTLIAMVLMNPRLDVYAAGREDIAAGMIDARILTILQLASERHALRVSSLRTGHSRCVGGVDYDGCKVSNHWYGRGVDVSMVDGDLVKAANAAARQLALWLAGLPEPIRPGEVGSPWPDLAGFPGYFSDSAHADHLHIAVP